MLPCLGLVSLIVLAVSGCTGFFSPAQRATPAVVEQLQSADAEADELDKRREDTRDKTRRPAESSSQPFDLEEQVFDDPVEVPEIDIDVDISQ